MLRHRSHAAALALAAVYGAAFAACGGGGQTTTSTGTGAGGGASGTTTTTGGAATTSTTTTTSGSGGMGGTGGGSTGPLPALTAMTMSTRFDTADAMVAAAEMQISGEPFAELLGRSLGGYDRFSANTDTYLDPATGQTVRDLLGWSLAIESYEYSKQPMNNLSFESGAGLSLQFGPIMNPTAQTGDPAYQLMLARLQFLAQASRATGAKFGKDFVSVPPPANDAQNAYGWPGFWPVFAEYSSFDPTIAPSVGDAQMCSLAGATDEPQPPGSTQYVGDYECDYTTLNLPNRDQQVTKVLSPDALGYAAWKQGLWVINYWSSFHDVDQDPIIQVASSDLSGVGIPDNMVIGQWQSPLTPGSLVFGFNGTYLGDVSLEGWQGLVMIEEMDNKSAFLTKTLATADGQTLSGFASVGDADDYDYQAPLRWWPAAVAVTETATAPSPDQATKYFPQPTTLSIQDGSSRIQDISGVLSGAAEFYAMTDEANAGVGGTQEFLATFDGSPWPADDGMVDGEDTMHDRTLGLLKVGLVNLDRLHWDAAHAVLVDSATVGSGGAVTRGTTVTTYRAAYAIVAMRTAFRALSSSLALYSNDTPDTLGAPTPLDGTSLAGAPYTGTLSARVTALIKAEGDFIAGKILDSHGLAANAYDLATGTRDPSPVTIEAQAAAIRGLLDAYLATGDNTYRQAATLAYQALDATFWMDDAETYRTTAGESATMTWTPRSFAALHGALRQFYKLVALIGGSGGTGDGGLDDGKTPLQRAVLARVQRNMKLIVNGWNDKNRDGVVQPDECMGGRLQMAERALTGELSIATDMGDRDHDCVKDIATMGLPSALAEQIVIQRP
jgi:hypothetical protein